MPSSGVGGRLARLGSLADTILKRHDYPEPVSRALGEALVLAAILGTALKLDRGHEAGRFILQTKTDGPLGFLVADFESPGRMRGYASFDKQRTEALIARGGATQKDLLGRGHLGLTIDPGRERDRYQGIVPLDGETLAEAANTYFRQSEQIPTLIRLAVARHIVPGTGPGGVWRAGGLLVQYRPPLEVARLSERDEEMGRIAGESDEDWQRVRLLASTVEDHELIDPMVGGELLLWRLFHEEDVRAREPVPLAAYCRCSRERVETMLNSFSAEDLAGMREADGALTVTCEFCNTSFRIELGAGS
jgi:molecular chaperone Hsp33